MIDTQLVLNYYGLKNGINIDFRKDVIVVNYCDGCNPQIEEWNIEEILPQPSMEELEKLEPEAMLYYRMQDKFKELTVKFDEVLLNGHCMSSLGFEVDANVASVRNIGGLIVVMGAEDVENFFDYNNDIHALTRQQIETLQVEIIKHIQSLYDKKWAYREKINACETAEELDKIVIDFCTENTKYFTDDMKIISRKTSTNLIKNRASMAS